MALIQGYGRPRLDQSSPLGIADASPWRAADGSEPLRSVMAYYFSPARKIR
jgi:hypothetical protein